MPSGNTYRLTWVSLSLDLGHLSMAAPAKHSCSSLSWRRGISSRLPWWTAQKRGHRWGATRRQRSGVATKSARLRVCRSGGEELPHPRGQGRWPRGATPCPRSGAVAERNSPRSKEWQLRGRRRALRGASRFKGAMLSKCLIQFSVDGRGCVPSLLFDLRPNYGGGTEDNGDLLQKVLCRHCFTECPQACSRPLSTHALAGDSWTLTGKSGSVSD